ncbi:unnamed protein product [Toxocara canis]|uniref:G_PROTEIN_RECEP_F1_2 domain-containing protein n=1 Tax=Toxocara canis TaxID=6265 RepID=A0A183TYE0_TOXCA|nr:unnamed protein product [Toxocara canis]
MPPTLLSELSQCWLLGPFMCKIAAYLQPVAVCASAYTLAVIAVERYYAICCPLQSRKWHSKRHAVSMISFVWFISFTSNSGSLAIFDALPYKTAWNCRSIASPLVDFFYQVYVTLILLLIPLSIMSVLYGNVIFTLKTGIRFDVNLAVSMNSFDCGNNIYGTRFRRQLDGRRSTSSWLFDAMFFPTWATKPFTDMNVR